MDIKHKIICEYRNSANSPKELLNFLLSNYRNICKEHSFNTFKEMTLNYRILCNRTKRDKIISDYEKYVLTKQEFHKSNLVISYNMINQLKVNTDLQKKIVEYMYSQIKDNSIDKFRSISNFSIKKHIIMTYIENNILDTGVNK